MTSQARLSPLLIRVLLINEYRDRLGVPESSVMKEQRQDLEKAARAVRRLCDGLGVAGFLAHTTGARIRFEPV